MPWKLPRSNQSEFPTLTAAASAAGPRLNRIPFDLFKFRPRVRPSVSSMHTTLPPHQLRLIHILPLLRAGFESCFLSQPILTFGFLPIIKCVLFSSTPISWSHQTRQSMELHPTLNKPGDLSCLNFLLIEVHFQLSTKLLQGLRTTRRLHPASRVILHQLEPNCLVAREPCKAVRQGVGQVPLRGF